MRQKAVIGALLLVGVGVVLGATVLRDQVASAKSLAQSVFVNNTSANPVPVSAAGTLPVHEQGTATVNVANSSLSVQQAGQPVEFDLCFNPPSSSCDGLPAEYVVPSGKRLVIQEFSCRVAGDFVVVWTRGVNGSYGHWFPTTSVTVSHVASEQVTIYASQGDHVVAADGGAPAQCEFDGVLMNI